MLKIPDTPDLPKTYSEEALAATNKAIRFGRAIALSALSGLKLKWETDRYFLERSGLLVRSILCQKLVACLLDDSSDDISSIGLCLSEMAASGQFSDSELVYAGQAAFGLFSTDRAARQTLREDLTNQKEALSHIPHWINLVVKMME